MHPSIASLEPAVIAPLQAKAMQLLKKAESAKAQNDKIDKSAKDFESLLLTSWLQGAQESFCSDGRGAAPDGEVHIVGGGGLDIGPQGVIIPGTHVGDLAAEPARVLDLMDDEILIRAESLDGDGAHIEVAGDGATASKKNRKCQDENCFHRGVSRLPFNTMGWKWEMVNWGILRVVP